MDLLLSLHPVFDKNINVYGYKVLYYINSGNEAAYSKAVIDALDLTKLYTLTRNKPVFLDFTKTFIEQETALAFPSKKLVIDLPEYFNPDKTIVKQLDSLNRMGYIIASGNGRHPAYTPGIIRIDFLNNSDHEIQSRIKGIKEKKVLLADKLETGKSFEYAKELGCDLFQGFFYCRQETYTNKDISPGNLTYLRLIQKVNQDTIDFKEVSYIISRDVSLSYKLLRLVNSVAFGFREKISSIKHALVIIGENELRKWVSLISLRGIGDDRPEELTRTILVRARFLELLSHKTGLRYRSYDMFLLGLFSMLDVFMGQPIKELLNGLPISYDIIKALLYREGPLFDPYRLVISCERGRFSDVLDISALLGIDVPSLLEIYLLALEWYESITLSKNP